MHAATLNRATFSRKDARTNKLLLPGPFRRRPLVHINLGNDVSSSHIAFQPRQSQNHRNPVANVCCPHPVEFWLVLDAFRQRYWRGLRNETAGVDGIAT